MKQFMSLLLSLAATAHLVAAEKGGGGFLFVTFKGEQNAMTEQIYFALSRDGRSWNALNASEPVLVSRIGEQGVRDPYLLRAKEGDRFFLIATDLSVHRLRHNWTRAVREGSRSIVVWESTNLVSWSEPRLVQVAPEDAGCTWAPEAVYDEDARDYLVFWASTTKGDDFRKHRIWAARTKDFKTFGEPFIFIEKAAPVIDTTIVRDDGRYVRFTKDERNKGITMETSDRLAGDWKDVPGFSLGHLRGYEGPECYVIQPASDGKPATWCLILDQYSRGAGYQPYVTQNLAGGKFTQATGFNFPFKFRHGSVLPVSAQEYQRLEEAYLR